MKKLFAIAFTCVYLTLTVGVVNATHYCMGRVNSTTLFSFESEKCFCAVFAIPTGKGCCDDEVNLVKIDDDQTVSWTVSISPEFYYMGEYLVCQGEEEPVRSGHNSLTIQSWPPGEEIPLFVRHCALILYSDARLA